MNNYVDDDIIQGYKPPAWETVHHAGSMECTERLKIDRGWLYRTRIRNSNVLPDSLALTFVPDSAI